MAGGEARVTPGTLAAFLWLLTGFFLARVLGQVLVAVFDVGFLTPMAAWYSGFIPYPILLPTQVAMLGVMVKINRDVSLGAGLFAAPRPRLGRFLRWFAIVYFLAMVGRYAITMALYPERRWLGGAIPIAFHWVLAGYLFLWSRYNTSGSAGAAPA